MLVGVMLMVVQMIMWNRAGTLVDGDGFDLIVMVHQRLVAFLLE